MSMVGSAPASQRGRVVWAGGAAAGVALLQFLQKGVEAVHLTQGVFWLLSALILVTGLGIGQWRELRARRETARARDAALDEALACWPPRRAASLTPYDVGVHPRLDVALERSPYLARDVVDEALREAIADETVVVVFGAAGAGKSRSAFHAVQEHAADSILLMPEDAKGLKALVAQAPPAVIGRDAHAVLWLEGLEEYLDGLDVDALLRFLHGTVSSRVVLVATIRDDVLERLLASSERAGLVVRRLLAHGRGVFVPSELSDGELARLDDKPACSRETRTVAAAFPANWRAGWPRCSPAPEQPPAARRRDIDAVFAALAGAFVALVAALVIVGETYGWTDAPPLGDQVSALDDDIRPCQRLQAYPEGGAGIEKARDPTARVLVAIVSGADCLESDEVRFYRRGSDHRLQRIGSLRPTDAATRLSFHCVGIGPGSDTDPCHTTLRGRTTSIVGAFRDGDSQQELPVVVSFEPTGLKLRALSLPARHVPAFNRTPMTVRLESASDTRSDAPSIGCQENLGCLSGRTAAAVAVLPPTAATPSVLLTGYARGRFPQAPDAVRVRVWKIEFQRDEPQRGRDCLVLARGRPRPALIRDPVLADLRADIARIARGWRPPRVDVMC